MKDEFSKLLTIYSSKERTHQVLVEAANDNLLQTDDLFRNALSIVELERCDKEVDNFTILVLQQRANDEVLNKALSLLENSNPAGRQLGCIVLREFPSIENAPYPHSARVIKALKKIISCEKDDEVLGWALAAVGWQCHPDGLEVLIQMKSDERRSIRKVVADNLLHVNVNENGLSEIIADAFLEFANDPDEDIRWSVFYDVADFPEMFQVYKDQFKTAALRAKNDTDLSVQEQACRALKALENL